VARFVWSVTRQRAVSTATKFTREATKKEGQEEVHIESDQET